MAKKKKSKTTEASIQATLEMLMSGELAIDQVTTSDSEQPGLRVLIRRNGTVTYHAQYEVGGERPYIKIGDFKNMRLSTAREVVKTIRTLAEHGINPFDRLHEQRVQELIAKGPAWRPPK